MPKETFFNLPDDKRRRILDVVIDEFADNDYANVSISRIVARAGIAKGSFYNISKTRTISPATSSATLPRSRRRHSHWITPIQRISASSITCAG